MSLVSGSYNGPWPPPDSSRYYSNISRDHWNRCITLLRAWYSLPMPRTSGLPGCLRWRTKSCRWCPCSWVDKTDNAVPHDPNYPDPEGLEKFLTTAEEVLASRKAKHHKDATKLSVKALFDLGSSILQSKYTGFFLGNVIWSFFERYPKFIPERHGKGRDFNAVIDAMLTLPASELASLIPTARALICFRWNYYGNWTCSISDLDEEKTCKQLCSAVLKIVWKQKELESADTIAIRRTYARHTDDNNKVWLYKQALDISQKVYGRLHETTLDIYEELGKTYLSQLNFVEVQSLFEKLAHEQQDTHGEDDAELRMRTIPSLAEVYLKQGDDAKTRELVWRVTEPNAAELFSENWPFKFRRSDDWPRLLHMIVLLGLEGRKDDFDWNELALAIFPFNKISLRPTLERSPDEKEKMHGWHAAMDLPCEDEKGNLLETKHIRCDYPYRVQKEADGSMTLSVPYIDYEHYQKSQEYKVGRTYETYRKCSSSYDVIETWFKEEGKKHFEQDSIWEYSIYLRTPSSFSADPLLTTDVLSISDTDGQVQKLEFSISEILSDRLSSSKIKPTTVPGARSEAPEPETEQKIEPEAETCPWIDLRQPSAMTEGLFNGTPGDNAYRHQFWSMKDFNMVSSDWVDWTRFVLHTVPPEADPGFRNLDGTPLKTLGYIYGTWTDISLTKRWTGVKVYVVDARFRFHIEGEKVDDADSKRCYFLFGQNALSEHHAQSLTAEQQRNQCASLNPSFYRLHARSQRFRIYTCTMGEGSYRDPKYYKGIELPPSYALSPLHVEQARREEWDREFQSQWQLKSWEASQKKLLEGQVEKEVERREVWDLRFEAEKGKIGVLDGRVVDGGDKEHMVESTSMSEVSTKVDIV